MLDAETVVSNAQSIAIAAGSVLSEKSYDSGAAGTIPAMVQAVGDLIHDIGRGGQLEACASIVEAVTSGGSSTTKCELVMADNDLLDSGLVVLADSGAIAKATLVAGYQFRFGTIPVGVTKRFLGFRYTVATATQTAGKVFAYFGPGRTSAPGTV